MLLYKMIWKYSEDLKHNPFSSYKMLVTYTTTFIFTNIKPVLQGLDKRSNSVSLNQGKTFF